MEDKAAAARRAYNQVYYRRNREKIRQQQAEYWKRKAEELETIKKGNNDGNQ
ncbi:MAG: phosphatase [Subdoligranulum sp.]